MIVLYRACPYKPQKPLPFNVDKYGLVKMCLESFMATKPDKIYFLLDGWDDKSLFINCGECIDCTGLGNIGTFRKQIEMAQDVNDDVFFVEDDYLWRPDTFKYIKEAVKDLDFVSPYDHPGHYLEPRFDKHYEMRLIGNVVYREAPSNTLTFAMRKEVANKTRDKMITFGISDHPMFDYFRKDYGLRMWNPTYSFATHCVAGLMAPNVEWSELQTP